MELPSWIQRQSDILPSEHPAWHGEKNVLLTPLLSTQIGSKNSWSQLQWALHGASNSNSGSINGAEPEEILWWPSVVA